MDRRDNTPTENAYLKDLQQQDAYDYTKDFVKTEDGKVYRVPYKTVKEVVFTNVSKDDLIDIEHCARVQYRLLLQESVLRAKIEFVWRRITITYNPAGADNGKEKISLQGLIDFLAGEGIRVDQNSLQERDCDYYKEIFHYQFNPPSIRERPPYSYSPEQWKSMKETWEKRRDEGDQEKRRKFMEWQDDYAKSHTDFVGDLPTNFPEKKELTFKEKLFGSKKKGEKGFWFHGV